MSMAGKKPISKKASASPQKKVNASSTHQEKLSDTKSRMEAIVGGNDQRHHLK